MRRGALVELAYSLPEAADVRLEAFDMLGRRVATLAEGPRGAGAQRATFATDGLRAGSTSSASGPGRRPPRSASPSRDSLWRIAKATREARAPGVAAARAGAEEMGLASIWKRGLVPAEPLAGPTRERAASAPEAEGARRSARG